jgi:hypothetical protein
MTAERSGLARDSVLEEARQILLTLGGNRDNGAVFEANWRKLWQLVREADARSGATSMPVTSGVLTSKFCRQRAIAIQ